MSNQLVQFKDRSNNNIFPKTSIVPIDTSWVVNLTSNKRQSVNYTAPYKGYYVVTLSAWNVGVATVHTRMQLSGRSQIVPVAQSGNDGSQTGTTICVKMNAGDVLYCEGEWQSAGNYNPYMWLQGFCLVIE